MAIVIRPLHACSIRPIAGRPSICDRPHPMGSFTRLARMRVMPLPRSLVKSACCVATLIGVGAGCQTKYSHIATYQPSTQPAPSLAVSSIAEPESLADVDALVTPPTGWVADPIKSSEQHKHQ